MLLWPDFENLMHVTAIACFTSIQDKHELRIMFIFDRMAMSNAERQRKYRQNRDKDAVRRNQYLQEERERSLKRAKYAKNMTMRESRHARSVWRKQKRKLREEQKRPSLVLTPPTSPSSPRPGPSRQKQRARIRQRNDEAKCYRDNDKLKKLLNKERRRADLYRKRLQRLRPEADGAHGSGGIWNNTESPKKKTKNILRNSSLKGLRKTLDFHNVLLSQIKTSYKRGNQKTKQRLTDMLAGSILKKYKMKSALFHACDIRLRESKCKPQGDKQEKKVVKDFYLRDDVSRVLPGVKRTMTHKKVKKQRRVLTDTLKNLYIKYKSETQSPKVCYSMFCRLRPFWVLISSEKDRDTCQCKTCENTSLLANSLEKAGVLTTNNIENLTYQLVCDSKNKKCMYRECPDCKDNRVDFIDTDLNKEVEWFQWQTHSEIRIVHDKEKKVSYVTKDTCQGSAYDLLQKFESELQRYSKHLFNVRWQYQFLRETKEELPDDGCVIHVDFSENYTCKCATEIQAMHFGASKKQITLHTGFYNIAKPKISQSFCTVSDDLHHGPAAVWSHMEPILKDIRHKYPHVTQIQFFSDGPVTQYRQKGNFHLFETEVHALGFHNATWNFFEAGHGKGIPDAIGGAVKRSADRVVRCGHDILNAHDFVAAVKGGEIEVSEISSDAITNKQISLDKTELRAIQGTLRLHQVISIKETPGVFYRDISCSCRNPNLCVDHDLNHAVLLSPQTNTYLPEQNVDPQCATDLMNPFEVFRALIESCDSYEQLTGICHDINSQISPLELYPNPITTPPDLSGVDLGSLNICPADIPDQQQLLYPCISHANGNCLPSSGSRFAFDSSDETTEIRVRIVVESVVHEDNYLDNKYLNRGLPAHAEGKNLPMTYAQYSDVFIPGTRLSKSVIRKIYRKEIMAIRKDKEYMGIWQIHALASVLGTPIQSIYPQLGNPNVRRDLHRLIMPQSEIGGVNPVHIMWTSTRTDMVNNHWIPNHFVPMLPLQAGNNSTVTNAFPPHANGISVTSDFLDQYVLVNYDGKYYPGRVVDTDTCDVYVDCMHHVGPKTNNTYFWPPKLRDLCWYDTDRVKIIPQPMPVSQNSKHFKVDDETWEFILSN